MSDRNPGTYILVGQMASNSKHVNYMVFYKGINSKEKSEDGLWWRGPHCENQRG
jgi:hypothetical protein